MFHCGTAAPNLTQFCLFQKFIFPPFAKAERKLLLGGTVLQHKCRKRKIMTFVHLEESKFTSTHKTRGNMSEWWFCCSTNCLPSTNLSEFVSVDKICQCSGAPDNFIHCGNPPSQVPTEAKYCPDSGGLVGGGWW